VKAKKDVIFHVVNRVFILSFIGLRKWRIGIESMYCSDGYQP